MKCFTGSIQSGLSTLDQYNQDYQRTKYQKYLICLTISNFIIIVKLFLYCFIMLFHFLTCKVYEILTNFESAEFYLKSTIIIYITY